MNQNASQIWNVPNTLSMLRLVLSVVVFTCIAMGDFMAAFVLFLITAFTDKVDGWWARKFNQVTQLGRMLDPFADKILICGAFIMLAAAPKMQEVPWGIQPWMAVLVMGREMLVTAIRGFVEQHGGNFSANWSGKIKMVFQCVAAAAGILFLHFAVAGNDVPAWLYWTLVASVWVTIISTIQSGMEYIFKAVSMLKSLT